MELDGTAEEVILKELRGQLGKSADDGGACECDGDWDYDVKEQQSEVNRVLCQILTSIKLVNPERVAGALNEIGEGLKSQREASSMSWTPEFKPLFEAAETIRGR